MKNKAPAFQFYPRDFLSDSRFMLMPLELRGAYITLVCFDWLEDGIPLSRIEDVSTLQLDSKECRLLRECFVEHPKKKDHVTAKMLVEVRARRADWIRKSSEGGKKSGRSRSYAAKGGSRMVDECLPNGSTKCEPNINSSSSSSSSTSSSSSDLNTNTPLAIAQVPTPKKKPELVSTRGKVQHGKYVWLSPEELERFETQHGPDFIKRCIEKLEAWIETDPIPKRIKNGRNAGACFRSWVFNSVADEQARRTPKQGQLGFKPHTAASTVEKNEQYIKETYGEEFFNQMLASPGFGEEELDFKPTGGSSVALLPEGTTKRIGN